MATSIPQPQTDTALQPGDLVDERAVAEIFGVAVQTLRNWRAKGEGPRWRKIGARCVRYHMADVAAYAEGGKEGAA